MIHRPTIVIASVKEGPEFRGSGYLATEEEKAEVETLFLAFNLRIHEHCEDKALLISRGNGFINSTPL